jgi:hypothetical protein
MNATVEEDIQRRRALVAALCRRHGARQLDLFGSATRDDFDAQHSDLDFLVKFEDLEPTQYAQAYFALKEGLKRLFGRPVDLVTENNLGNPLLLESSTHDAPFVDSSDQGRIRHVGLDDYPLRRLACQRPRCSRRLTNSAIMRRYSA